MAQGLVSAHVHAPTYGERHDENQAIQAVQRLELGILPLKTTALEVGKQRLSGKGLAR